MRPRPAALEPSASAWASSQAASLSATLSVTRVTRPADCRLLPTVAASPRNQTSRGAQSTAAVRRDTEYSRWLPTIRRGANRRQRPDYAVAGPKARLDGRAGAAGITSHMSSTNYLLLSDYQIKNFWTYSLAFSAYVWGTIFILNCIKRSHYSYQHEIQIQSHRIIH